MTLAPIWRTRFFAMAAAIVAVWAAADLAQGKYFVPAVIATCLVLLILARAQPYPMRTVLLAGATIGYVVGNRGFAQLTLVPGYPVLPAEVLLLVAGLSMIIQSAWRHEMPIGKDPLDLAIFGWIIYGALRVVFDVRTFGFIALRDFALVYYAAFYYVGQDMARDAASRAFYLRVFAISCLIVLPAFWLFDRYPEFFLSVFTLHGVPIIYYKGDLAATFIAAGSILFFLRYEEGSGFWNLVVSLCLAGAVFTMNSRAAMLGLALMAVALALRGRWHFAALIGAGGALSIATVLGVASVMRVPWEDTAVFSVYERVVSIVDPWGNATYRGADTFDKGDNNLYRAVWWRAVFDETVEGNPYVGLGFGHDLAVRFVRVYYPEGTEEFSVRSPHNVLMSIFARMGAVGLAVFIGAIGIIAVRTWRALGSGAGSPAAWCVVWTIFISACLGVVLEGPMGAVIFWTMLGVANATYQEQRDKSAADGQPDLALGEPVPVPAPSPRG